MKYQIRIGKRLNIADINEIHNLFNWGNYTPEQWVKVKKQSTFMVQIIINKKTIAFARCVDDSDFCTIYDVIVHPNYQKQGYGTILMQELLKYIKANNFLEVSLFYMLDNPGLDKFYAKFGFSKVTNAMQLKRDKLKEL